MCLDVLRLRAPAPHIMRNCCSDTQLLRVQLFMVVSAHGRIMNLKWGLGTLANAAEAHPPKGLDCRGLGVPPAVKTNKALAFIHVGSIWGVLWVQ
eukprot:8087217-Alexandrium_andersonii.AAC.1